MTKELLYRRISQMEPLLPQTASPGLSELAEALIRRSAALGAALHPITLYLFFEDRPRPD